MRSMTGYGRSCVEKDGRQLIIEIKSVNHRFLDISLKIPRILSFSEDSIRKQIAGQLTRGHIEVTVSYINSRDDAKKIVVDKALIRAYCDAAEQMETENGIKNDLTASNILSLPDTVSIVNAEEDTDTVLQMISDACQSALNDLKNMRIKEGCNLRCDIESHLNILQEIKEQISALAPSVPITYRERLIKNLQEMSIQPDEARIAQETAIIADKCAIDEELSRLDSHFSQMRVFLDSTGEIGKKMDFLTQEMNRECNTIGSKASDAGITKLVVDAKSEVEKIREQVQNVE